ncbi:MAG TPA: cupin domain-containing protein, partial [Flavobacterium sp.]|uniref:cupin domain-containing protein n=1 Tax=Flavobacterium sp. TaxID=239 RepID=UPI002ED6839A
MDSTISIINKNEGKLLGVAGGNYRIIISGEETNGNYAVIEMIVPPGGGPSPHAHPNTHEMFHVLEGEVEFKTEAGKQIVGKDGFVNIPFGGAVHCFKNTSEKYARLLCTVVPAGLENLFDEI